MRFLFSSNPTRAQVLYLYDDSVLEASFYNHSLPTKMIAHGHYGSPAVAYSARDGMSALQIRTISPATKSLFIIDLAYLDQGDCNVISVDWSVLAAGEYSFVADTNVPTAGLTTGEFVNYLIEKGTPLNAFHLIGFDMGVN